MMNDNVNDDMVMDFDLNQEPLDPPVDPVLGLGSLLNELETAHGRIEERIRQLEAVTARARQRQRWRQARNNPETSNISVEPMVNVGGETGVDSIGASERRVERGRICKRDSTHLVAKALEMDSDVKKVGENGGSFFDCNACLKMAREPILTCCGHMFCWTCFYQLPYVYSTAKECPACKGEVTDTNITPIYISGNNSRVSDLGSGFKVPPRPQAQRIESVRQQRITRGVSHIPVAEALRRIRTGIGAPREHLRQQGVDSVNVSSNGTLPNAEAGSSGSLRSRNFSRVLPETAASLSSISSALNNAERIVEDLESYIHDRILQRSHSQFLSVDGGNPLTSHGSLMQPEHQTMDSPAEINSIVPISSSPERTGASAAVMRLENLTTDTGIVHISSSSRRRGSGSRVSNLDNGVSRESRRRRF